jgi:hypothetical protein
MDAISLDSPNSRAVSRELLNFSRSTAAIMASSLAGACTVRGRPAFTYAVVVILAVLQGGCSNSRKTLVSL